MPNLEVVARPPRWRDRWWSVAPERGLYLGAACLSAAVTGPDARSRRAATRVVSLPEGAVVPSPVEPNIRRPDLVIERLQAALSSTKGGEAAISLPDAAVRLAILELAQVPAKRAEREALFRHHLEQLLLNPLGRCRFACQPLVPAGAGKSRVLVAAIREDILEEYEAVVRASGSWPSVVEPSVFHLFNLYAPLISASSFPGVPGGPGGPVGSGDSGEVGPPDRRVMFLNLFDRNFTMIVADRHGPLLIRIKAFPGVMGEGDVMARVLAEIDASLRASDTAATTDDPSIGRLFVFSDRSLGELDQRVLEDYHMETVRLPVPPSPDGQVEGGATDDARPAADRVEAASHASVMALAAVGYRARVGTAS